MTRFLVTNDDGVESPGLRELASALESLGEVIVVAPDREQSASGHALTLHRPLRLREHSSGVYSVDGTPTDCVNLAILWLLGDPPDLVVSGINRGLNLGDDVTYSGTVSATFEGVLLRVPSVAFSQQLVEGYSFERSAGVAARLVEALLDRELPTDLLLNVNLPAASPRGLRFTRLGHRVYQQVVVEKVDPRGQRYFWIAGSPEWRDEDGTDHKAIVDDCVSVTPLHLDLTDYRRLEADDDLAAGLAAAIGEPTTHAAE